jgi:hypothetical protein
MKKLIIVLIACAIGMGSASAAIRCERSAGGMCCWDTEKDGPYHPIGC